MISYPKGKIKVLLLENIHKDAYELFKKDGFDVTLEKDALDEADLAKRIGEIHILGIRSKTNVTPKVLANARRLLTIGCFCIGTNQVDLEGAEKIAVPVFNAPYSNTRSVAELVIAEIIMLARKATDQSRDVHLGKWNKIAKGCFEVRGKTLGIVGYGHIGSQVSVLAESMGMKVIFFDVIAKLPLGNASPVDTYEDLLQQADFITFHVPETEETENLFDKKHLEHIKPHSYLLNLSRGKVVNIEALAEGLKSGRIAGAGIDVYPEEPKSNDDPFKSPLQGLNNVILTPHVGGSTEEAQKNIGTEVAQKLLKFINNGSTTFSVNFPNIELGNLKPGFHRILNIHKNQPGFLRDINSIISEMGGNILSQHLSTSTNIGYLSMEIDRNLGDELKNKIKAHQHSIRTRILYLD
ncbi:phosphoglycerate dehydrogenase [Leptospira ilyithenensis]|uniref:D-3-phosphoglycerate dehydrogenase n=1 Tax=Leptospira ilyithenensis TaxID=2484901 RepID=A0A4R9LKT5_9LEPT|nr:phosphoglycerate dehydrogenase [Leptospira ilyithenensis]TGN08152.1 phosphoglycerate dehydrogenase [Leptospira ilyithenensis]